MPSSAGVGGAWQAEHARTTHARSRLSELEARQASGTLGREELDEILALSESVEGDDAALERCRNALDRGDSPSAFLRAGRIHLRRGDASGVALVEKSMAFDRAHRVAGARMLFKWHDQRGETEASTRHARAIEEHEAEWERSIAERSSFLRTQVLPHGLTGSAAEAVSRHLETVPGLRRAWLVQRPLRHVPDVPAFVLVIQRRRRLFEATSVTQKALQAAVETPVPGTLHVLSEAGTYMSFRSAAKKAGPPVFERR